MHKKLVKIALGVLEISCRTDRHTNRQPDALITILCNRSCGWSNYSVEFIHSSSAKLLPREGILPAVLE